MQHRARRRFGQNFLVDQGVIIQLIQTIAVQAHHHIVEIGAGRGALTKQLIQHCQRLTAIEIDRDLIAQLERQFQSSTNNFQLINGDVLELDFATLTSGNGQKIRIVGNLPYNISTPLLLKLTQYTDIIEDMYFMLQKEVVQRICAQVGNRDWGRLSVMLQYHFNVEYCFDVPPEAFQPRPKVQSAIVRMSPKVAPTDVKDKQLFSKIVGQSFHQKRKTIRNNLKSLFDDKQFTNASVDPSQRPEHLSVEQLVRLSNQYFDEQ